MNFKGLIWLILLLSFIISIGFVSGSEVNDTNKEIIIQSSGIDLNDINGYDVLESSLENQISSKEDNSHVIYVGQNKTIDGGNGTQENPFNSFELVCNNSYGDEKIEINVYNGTYYLDSDLKFNTSNLFINGLGQVVIKNLENKEGAYASFVLSSSSGNFTFNNLIFDGSNCTSDLSNLILNRYFHVFKGNANLGILNNCTFTGFNNNIMFSNQFNRKFICCNFLDTYNYISRAYWYDGLTIDFEYCVISNGIYLGQVPFARNSRLNLTYNNVWFGSNSINEYLYYDALTSSGTYTEAKSNLIRYAIFSASENYLGNNTYEIIGKLTWNDSTTDGIEMLRPLTVKFSSRSGEIQKTTILENGFFKVIYKSNSKDNEISIDLDYQEIILEFKNGVQAIINPINVGDEQIITVSLPQAINSIVNITIDNKTYEVQSNGLSIFNFTVPDNLEEGNYQVDVKIIDDENHVYGFNTTNWTISKINKDITIITPADANINDKYINITVLLEKDASGNITVFVRDKNMTKECFGRTLQVDISPLLSAGENDIKVVYSGNKKYLSQVKSEKIFVNKIYPNIIIKKPTTISIGDEVCITVLLPNNALGNITLSIGINNLSVSNVSQENKINISNFIVSGYNTLLVKYSGDDFWDSQIKKETIYVSKTMPIMNINLTKKVVKMGENTTIQINLSQNVSGNISLQIGKNNYLVDISSEKTLINVSSSILGINYINVTYNGDKNYFKYSKIINFTVEKFDISLNDLKINITNNTVPYFLISLPSILNGDVIITINGKDYFTSLVNGSAGLKIYNLTPNTYQAIVSYESDKFNKIYSIVSFTVPKPQLKAKNIKMLYTSGLKYNVHVSASGNPVIGKTIVFIINGEKTTAITNNKGYASVKIDLPPKSTKYSVTAYYQGVKITNKIKVNSIVQAKNVQIKKSSKTLKIKVSLKKVNKKFLKNKKITLKFKGKKYVAKTNKNGLATFKITKNVFKKLKIGKSYNYQVYYLKDCVSKKITVKK